MPELPSEDQRSRGPVSLPSMATLTFLGSRLAVTQELAAKCKCFVLMSKMLCVKTSAVCIC